MTIADILCILDITIERSSDDYTVNFTGLEAFDYYYGVLDFLFGSKLDTFRHFSWQVQTAFNLIILSLLAMAVVAFKFFRHKRELNKFQEELKEVNEHLRPHFYNILTSADEYTTLQILEECELTAEDVDKISPTVIASVISELRLELSEVTYLPNIDILCEAVGVKRYYETNLMERKDIINTLQNIVTMNISISEGLLATWINHHNDNIRHMARMCYIICTKSEPYRYLEEDLQEKQALWRPMMLHRLFGWLHDTERQMPQFLVLASVMNDDTTAAFLVEEIGYWGSANEKKEISTFFLSPMYKVREAALKVVTFLHDLRQEEAIIDSYEEQPEYLRRECLRAIHAINSGKYTDFFVNSYYNTSSKETRECALSCLYSYGTDGRRRFEQMRSEIASDKQGIMLLNQIDSLAVLQQMRLVF